MLNYYPVLDLIAAISLLTMASLVHENNRFDGSVKHRFYLTYLFVFSAMLAEYAGLLLNGAPSWTTWLHVLVKCMDYILTPFAGLMIIRQLSNRSKLQNFVIGLMICNGLLQVLSIFTGWTFYLTADNIYHHGPLYPLYTLIYVVTLVCVFIAVRNYGKLFPRQNRGSLLIIVLSILLAATVQELWGYRISYLVLVLACIMLYIHYSEYLMVTSDVNLQRQEKLLTIDTLTGLLNRYAYTNDMNDLKTNGALWEDFAVFSIDINELKTINDTYGHLSGDEVICGVSDCIRSTLSEYGSCYRTGGDEFIAFLHCNAAQAYNLVQNLNKEADAWHGTRIDHLSLSAGYTLSCEHPNASIEELIRLADERMYEAKTQYYVQSGKSRRKSDVKSPEVIARKEKEYMDIISALASDVTGLYVIDRAKQEVTTYRRTASDHRIQSGVPLEQVFEKAMEQFIAVHVHPEDREAMTRHIRSDYMEQTLAVKHSFTFHFRTIKDGELFYHYMKCIRNIDSDAYDKVIVSFCPEDAQTHQQTLLATLQNQQDLDPLTGLYTKEAFLRHAQTLINSSPEESFTIIVFDVLHFKLYNSVYGTSAGDRLLKLIGEQLGKLIGSGVNARYGDDMFISILKMPSPEKLTYLSDQMQEVVLQNFDHPPLLKFGVYQDIDHSLKVSQMCDRALQAVTSIKKDLDRSYAYYDGPVSQQEIKAQLYESLFGTALKNNEFVVWYQPKYNAYTGKVIGAEALVRWRTSDGTLLPPSEFLPVFEADGLIGQLDEYVFTTVCAQQKKWKGEGKRLIPISVNLSRNSMHREDIVQRYRDIVDAHGIEPKYVPIEITESAAAGNVEIKPLADQFFESGFVLHMDDFGSGKSSIAGLNLLHFDTVKLDKSLIDFIGDPDGNLVLMYTVAMSKELGMHLIAEGVETQEQVDYLKDIGCEGLQGYYCSKPLPVDAFEAKITGKLHSAEQAYDYGYKLTAADSVVRRAMSRLFRRIPGGFFTYRRDNGLILSSNPYLWNMFGCSSEAEFMEHVGGTFQGLVYPEDLARVEAGIERQITDSENELDYVEYRIRKKDGTLTSVVDYGHLDHQPDGDIFYVFVSEVGK